MRTKYTQLNERQPMNDSEVDMPDAETMKLAGENIKEWRKKYKDWKAGKKTEPMPAHLTRNKPHKGGYMKRFASGVKRIASKI